MVSRRVICSNLYKNCLCGEIFYYFLQKSFLVYTQRQRAEDNKSRDNNNNTLDTVSAKNKSTETCLQGSQRNETSRCFAGINPQLLEFTSVETARCILMMGLFWRPM